MASRLGGPFLGRFRIVLRIFTWTDSVHERGEADGSGFGVKLVSSSGNRTKQSTFSVSQLH